MKATHWILCLTLFLSACTFSVSVENVNEPTPLVLTPTSPAQTLDPTPAPTFTPIPILPARFSNARFTGDPNTNNYQNIFPAKIKRIYAVWDYQNMREGLTIRRDWYRNGVLWITREEPWDFARYGANGTITDISIYDLNTGLESGDYHFELFIDAQPQPIGDGVTWPSFTISQSETALQATSPNGLWWAYVDDPRKLLLMDHDRNTREVFSGKEIASLTWLPDSKHFLFIDRDRSQQQGASNVGVRDDLWIVNVDTGETNLLHKGNTGLFSPFAISPNGQYVAGIEGSGYGDGCGADARVVIFELNTNFKTAKHFGQNDFAGLPRVAEENSIFPIAAGEWQNNTQIKVPLTFACSPDPNLEGSYLFDLISMKVRKAGQ